MIIVAEYIFAGAEKGLISAIFAISSLQKTKIAFESIEFSKCLGKWKCDFIPVLDLKIIISLVRQLAYFLALLQSVENCSTTRMGYLSNFQTM